MSVIEFTYPDGDTVELMQSDFELIKCNSCKQRKQCEFSYLSDNNTIIVICRSCYEGLLS